MPDTVKIQSLNSIGKKHFIKREFDSCEIYAKAALILSENKGDKHYIAVSNKILGQIYLSKNNHPAALKHYLKAIEIYRDLKDTTSISYLYGLNDIGYIYTIYGMYSKSYEYYLKALKIAEKLDDEAIVISTNIDIAELYYRKKEFDKSMSIYLKTLRILSNAKDTISFFPSIFSGLANNYLDKKQYIKSLSYFNRVINLGRLTGDSVTISAGQLGIATNYLNMNNYDSAIKYINKSLLVKTNNFRNNAVSYGMLGHIYIYQKNIY
jgi:tetratricopeptide (TPR) repeat protein